MSSLAEQLKKLAVPQGRVAAASKEKGHKSLLFDPKEAAGLDRDTVFSIGVNGIQELETIDVTFQEFEDNLFNEGSKTMERSVQTQEVNKKLDKQIRSFLLRLSPYFTLKPAQKALEWLIYRFGIHEYNIDDIMLCILPYHTTKLFVRVVQLFNISSPTHNWHWLQPIQESGVSLSCEIVLNRCHKDPGFLQFVCNIVPSTVKAYKGRHEGAVPHTESVLRLTFSFYVSTLIGAMELAPSIREEFLAVLVPFLTKGLKSSYQEYKAATYMIISQLCAQAFLDARLLHPLIENVCKKYDPSLEEEMISCLAVIYQTQNLKELENSAFHRLCNLPNLVPVLRKLQEERDISSLLQVLMQQMMQGCLVSPDESPDHMEVDQIVAEKETIEALLEQMVTEIPFGAKLSTSLIKFLLKCFMKTDSEAWTAPFFRSFISNLERKYPTGMDSVVQDYASKKLSEENERKLQTFMQMTTAGSKYQVLPQVETSLVLSLNHPSSDARELAVKRLLSLNQSGQVDIEFLQSSLTLRIEDGDQKVVLAVLQFGDDLCNVLSASQLMMKLEKILARWHRKSKGLWPQIANEIMTLLTSQQLCEDEADKDRAAAIILPYLLPSSSEKLQQDMTMFQQIATSDVARSHDLLKGLSRVTKEKSSKGNLRKLMTNIFQVLAQNLSKCPAERRLDLVKSLVEYHQEHHLKEAFGFMLGILLTKVMKLLPPEERLPIAEHLLKLLAIDLEQVQRCETKGELLKMKNSQEHSDEGIPAEVVSCLGQLLVSKVPKGNKISSEWLMGNLWCLEMMVAVIEIPEDIAEENAWLDLQEDSPSAGDKYLLLLVKIFEQLTQGVTYANDVNVGSYFKDILSLLVKKHFSNLTKFWSFLSMLCTAHCRLPSNRSYVVSYLLQVCCLQVANISFSAAGSDRLEEVLQEKSHVFPSLLVTLGHPSESVRKMAVECLSTIQGGCSATTPYSQLMKYILKRESEIVADEMYLPQALHLALSKAGGEEHTKGSGKGKKITQGSIDWLVGCISSDRTPYHVRCALMEMLNLVDNEKLLSSLLPTLSKALEQASSSDGVMKEYSYQLAKSIVGHFKPSTASLLDDLSCREGFWQSLTLEMVLLEGQSLQGVALEQVTPAFFEALPSVSVQQEIFKHLIDISLKAKSSETVKTINKIMRKLPLSSELIISEFSGVLPDKNLKNLQDARQARKRKQQKKTDEKAAEISEKSWQRATFILEHLQQRKLSKMEGVTKLVPEFFSILSVCLESSGLEDNLEYVKQLLLTLIHSICDIIMKSPSEESASNIGKLTEEQFNVELVVQCVRTSDNPQTHNHALLVLTIAAELFPEHLLHNVMSIFTFMGASVLRQDDGYSFQVINKTLQTVIPALMKASEEGALPQSLGENVHNIVFMIIRVFVDSFPHIPDHRKLPLFTQLIQTVDAERYLWSCIVLLVERFAMKGSAALYPEETEDAKGTGRIQQFWSSLCLHFTPQIQIISVTKMFQFLSTLPEDKGNAPSSATPRTPKVKPKKKDAKGYESLLDLARFSGKHLRQLKFTLVGFFASHLSDEEFISQVASLSEEDRSHLQELYQLLLEENLRYAQQVAQSGENNAENTTAKFWKALLHRLYDVLDKVNALLPADVFIRVISGLLSNELASVRRKAMELLNNILTQHKTKFTEEECMLLLGLVQQLTIVAQAAPDSMNPEVDVNRQTALYSLKLLCKMLGPDNPRQFTQVIDANLVILKQEQSNVQLVSSSLLCIAEAVSVLRAHSIPFLSRLVPLIIQMLSGFEDGDSSSLHLLCTVTSTQKVVEVLPNFISPYVQDILHQVIRLSCNKSDEKTQLNLRLKSCCQTLSKKLPIRVLLPAVTQTYAVVESTHPSSLVPLMTILEDHISSLSKEDVLGQHSNMTAFFLEALDFRTKHSEVGLDETSRLEKSIISAVLMHVMKLSENTFRPMYFKFFDWATRNDAPRSRLLTFYHLSDAIAEKLRSIFSLFAGHIASNCAELLDSNNTAKTEESFFTGDNGRKKACLLIQLILSCLQKCFVHDKGAFVNKERFELLSQPLVDQLENDFSGDEVYQEMVSAHLAPCITTMMASVKDQGIWQPLNYQLLLKMRHSSAKVRFAALVILDNIHQALKENYLSLLPETIPFLAELMEDESEEVEHKCQDIVRELEKTLGEPLQKHF